MDIKDWKPMQGEAESSSIVNQLALDLTAWTVEDIGEDASLSNSPPISMVCVPLSLSKFTSVFTEPRKHPRIISSYRNEENWAEADLTGASGQLGLWVG